MNEFASTTNASGILKNDYDDSMLSALKNRRKNLTYKISVPTKEKLEATDLEEQTIKDQNAG